MPLDNVGLLGGGRKGRRSMVAAVPVMDILLDGGRHPLVVLLVLEHF